MESIESKIKKAIKARAEVDEDSVQWLLLDELVNSLLARQHSQMQDRNRSALMAAGYNPDAAKQD